MKNILNAVKALFLFQSYTDMPRWMEISYGLIAWLTVTLLVCTWVYL